MSNRVGDTLTRDIRRGAVHGLEHTRQLTFGVDIGRRRDTDRTCYRRTEIGQDVSQQITAHDHVEPVRMQHEVGREYIDVVLVGADVGVILRDRPEALVPEGHGMDDTVGLRCRGDMFRIALSCQLERVAHDAVNAFTREDILLDRHFRLRAAIKAPTNLRVLAFVILTHNEKIDILRTAITQR